MKTVRYAVGGMPRRISTALGVLLLATASLAACGARAAGTLVFTAAGDYGTTAESAATLGMVKRAKPQFHLALGDLSYTNDPEARWCAWVTDHLGPDVPFMLLPGNHEDDFGEHGHITRFAQCLPDRLSVAGKYPVEYFFDVSGLARVILISPDLTVEGEHYYYGDRNSHYVWLAETIDAARAAGLPWVVVAMHKSCVSVGQYSCNIYSQLMDLLLEKRVDVLLHAHDHSYQRTRQLALGPGCPSLAIDGYNAACVADGRDDTYEQGRGTVSVIVATAGQPLYALNPHDPESGYFARWMGVEKARHGVLRIDVSPSTLSGTFVPSTGTSDFTDRFVIRHRVP